MTYCSSAHEKVGVFQKMKYTRIGFTKMKTNRSYLIAIGLISALLLSGCGEGEDRQASYLKRAQEHLAAENYDKASVDARNVLQINPKNLEARLVLADIAFNQGELRKAFGAYSAVVGEQPENVPALSGLSKIYVAVRDYEKALDHADRALILEPQNADVMGFKALALMGQGSSEEAYMLAQKALESDAGNPAALGVVTQYLSQQENYQAAIERLNQGQASNPDDARIPMMKISVYEALGDMAGLEQELLGLTKRFPESVQHSNTLVRFYIRESAQDKAEAEVFRYAEVNAESYEAKRRVIEFLLQQESQERAVAQAEKYMQADEYDTRLINTLAEIYLFTGDKDKASEVLQQSIATDPESVGAIEARVRLTQLYLQDKELDKASEMIADILAIEPENEMALMSRAGLSLADRKLKDATIDLRTVVKNNPENKQALAALAQTQEAAGSVDLALDNYKKLMALGDRETQTLASAARLAIQTEQYQEAEKYIRLALDAEEQSDNPQLVTGLVRLLALKEDWAAAEEFAQRLIDSDDASALGYFLKGGIKQQTGDSSEALAAFRASLAEQPNALETLGALSTLLAQTEGKDKATEFMISHCDSHQSAQCYYVLGTLHAQETNFAKAKSSLEVSLEQDDQFIRAYKQLAKVYIAQKDADGYESILLEGIEKTQNQSMRFDLATFYYSRGEYQAAANIYEAMIERRPEGALAAKNNLAMILAENLSSPDNIKRARALTAELQESENAAYLDTVGWVAYLSGDYETAITYTKAAVNQLGSAALLQYHLGMAYYKAGDAENARQHLMLATADVESKYPGYEEALTTLESL